MGAFFFIFISLLFSISARAVCQSGYVQVGSECQVVRPSLEFFYGAYTGGVPTHLYPICGSGRVPLTGDGQYQWSTMASSGVPKSTLEVIDGGNTYKFLKSGTAPPVYGYDGLTRCACVNRTIPEGPQVSSFSFLGPLSSGEPRVLPDVAEVISSQTTSGLVAYGMVAIANNNGLDGRLGSLYETGISKCGCPNFNEVPVSVDLTAPPTDPVGVRCVPAVLTDPMRVLARFEASVHDVSGDSQVMNRTDEMVVQSTSDLVSEIMLPRSLSDQVGTQSYQRRIWTCAHPHRLNPLSGACEFQVNRNACDEGNASIGIPASEMLPTITGYTKIDQFRNTMNKKLGACLNEFGSSGSTVKFDCIENYKNSYASFEDLWTSTDDQPDGGQPNAFLLADSSGRYLTGFFTLDGRRCDQYSEFADDIQRGKLTKNGKEWAFTSNGATIVRPSTSLDGARSLIEGLQALGKRVPQTPQEKLECPVLIRTAMLTACPQNPPLPVSQKTIEIRNTSGVVIQRRCSVASSVQVHVKIEQIFEIDQVQSISALDTFSQANATGPVSVSVITGRKYGDSCPPGTVRQGDICVY